MDAKMNMSCRMTGIHTLQSWTVSVTCGIKCTHGEEELRGFSHLDKLLGLFLVVVPEPVVDPEAQQLQRGLGAEEVYGRHVEVVQEAQQTLSACRHKLSFGPLLHAALHDGLDVTGGGLEIDGQGEGNCWSFSDGNTKTGSQTC